MKFNTSYCILYRSRTYEKDMCSQLFWIKWRRAQAIRADAQFACLASPFLVRYLTDRLTDRQKQRRQERKKQRKTDRKTEDRIFFVVPRDAYRIANHNCSAETTTRWYGYETSAMSFIYLDLGTKTATRVNDMIWHMWFRIEIEIEVQYNTVQ